MEYKFRGRRVDTKEWVYGLPQYSVIGGAIYIDTIQSIKNLRYYEIIPETVGQYTGLKDCTQAEMYNGDIVRNDYGHNGVIMWRNDRFIINWINNKFGYGFDLDHWAINRNIVVIGNAIDNPELLQEVSQ